MKKKRDVVFLCQYFYPEYITSATLSYDTALAFVDKGFTVDVICGYPKEYTLKKTVPKKEIHKGISIRRVKYIQMKRAGFIGRMINYFSFSIAVSFQFWKLKNYKAIIVYSTPPVLPFIAAVARKIFKVKMIFVSYDVYPEIAQKANVVSKKGFITRLMIIINNSVFKRVDKVVALSTEMKDYLFNNRKGITCEQIVVIPNWQNELKESKPSCKQKRYIVDDIDTNNKFIVSHFGNLGVCQDLETMIATIRALKDDDSIKFLFAGHGNKMKILKEIIERENLKNVTVYGFLNGVEYYKALDISDCFLVSLIDGMEGLAVPSKTYGYMMAGKPIIAIMSDNTDITQDLKRNKAGFVIEGADYMGLKGKLLFLKNNPTQSEKMGVNARKLFLDKYTNTICTNKYVDLLRNLLEE